MVPRPSRTPLAPLRPWNCKISLLQLVRQGLPFAPSWAYACANELQGGVVVVVVVVVVAVVVVVVVVAAGVAGAVAEAVAEAVAQQQ